MGGERSREGGVGDGGRDGGCRSEVAGMEERKGGMVTGEAEERSYFGDWDEGEKWARIEVDS